MADAMRRLPEHWRGKGHGLVLARITIDGATGLAADVDVEARGVPLAAGVGVAMAVCGAEFGRFTRSKFRVNYPFRL